MEGRLYDAPIDKPQRVLDIGTGTGIWALDITDKLPMAEVIGTDITPMQPQWVPPNGRFEVDDAEAEWTYHPESFDFVHVRNIAASISNWEHVRKEIYRCTPGGYVELGELGSIVKCDDGSMSEDNPLRCALQLFSDAMVQIDRPFPVAGTLKKRLEDFGFVDVVEITYKQPFGPWPRDPRLKNVGAMALLMLETGMEAYGMAPFTRILRIDAKVAAKMFRDSVMSAKNRRVHMYNDFYVAYGRKPGKEV